MLLGVGVCQIFIRSFAVLWLCGCFRYIALCMVSVDYCPQMPFCWEITVWCSGSLFVKSQDLLNVIRVLFFQSCFQFMKDLFLSTNISFSLKALAISTIEQIKLKICQLIYIRISEYFRKIFKKGYVFMISRKFNRWAYVMVSIDRSHYATVWATM